VLEGLDGYGQWTSSMGRGAMTGGQQGLFNSPFTTPQQAPSFPQSPGMSYILGQMGGGGGGPPTAPGFGNGHLPPGWLPSDVSSTGSAHTNIIRNTSFGGGGGPTAPY